MNQKYGLTRDFKLPLIRRELRKLYCEDTTKRILTLAQQHYAQCQLLCENAPKGEQMHLRNTILPTVSIYNALLEMDPGNALTAANTVMTNLCKMGGAFLGSLLKLPGMPSVFFRFLPKMADRMFGTACGFQYENRVVGGDILQMDMTACPYCRYARLFGCPELIPVFCDSDFATYGNLPGIRFQRTQTLGTGADRCDFRFCRELD